MTDLTDRMRTCAAFIMSLPSDAMFAHAHALHDAAALLIEASDTLESYEPNTEPMEIIEPPPPGFTIDRTPSAMWTAPGDALPKPNPYRGRHTCPRCDSRANKTLRRGEDDRIMLICPACAATWELKP